MPPTHRSALLFFERIRRLDIVEKFPRLQAWSAAKLKPVAAE
jgi:hypothetical protein